MTEHEKRVLLDVRDYLFSKYLTLKKLKHEAGSVVVLAAYNALLESENKQIKHEKRVEYDRKRYANQKTAVRSITG